MACYLLPFGPARGRAIITGKNKVPWCAAAGAMLRRRYAKNAYLKSLVLHKDQAIRRANGRRETARIWAEMRRSRPTYAPVALAPPKRSFQRGITSRL